MNMSIQGVFDDRAYLKKYARVHPNDAQMQAINSQMRVINAVHASWRRLPERRRLAEQSK
jgi:hypothetical protein